jgi:hypothetical protein
VFEKLASQFEIQGGLTMSCAFKKFMFLFSGQGNVSRHDVVVVV